VISVAAEPIDFAIIVIKRWRGNDHHKPEAIKEFVPAGMLRG
jgi:hypothetical protein